MKSMFQEPFPTREYAEFNCSLKMGVVSSSEAADMKNKIEGILGG